MSKLEGLYAPQVGHRVQRETWQANQWLDVEQVRNGYVYGPDNTGRQGNARIEFNGHRLYRIPRPGDPVPCPPTGHIVVDPDTGGARFDLLPWDALWLIAEHYGTGAAKYADRNWERGYMWSLSFAAAQRHLAAWWQGEDNDPELGTSHLAAAAFHVLTLLAYTDRAAGTDDRPATGRSTPDNSEEPTVADRQGNEGCSDRGAA